MSLKKTLKTTMHYGFTTSKKLDQENLEISNLLKKEHTKPDRIT